MFKLLLQALRYKDLLLTLVDRDISKSHTGSVLGAAWAFIDPIVYIALTVLFFQFVFRGQSTGGVSYVAWVLPQIILWTFISAVVIGSLSSVQEYSYLMRHRDFDLRLVAGIKLLSALAIHLLLIALLLIVLVAFFSVNVGVGTLKMFYYLACLCALLVPIAWIVSSMSVFWKDVRNIVSVVLQIEFWVSPIFWTADRFPKPVAIVMQLNPLYYPMHGFRQSILMADYGGGFWVTTVYFWAIVAMLAFFGAGLFRRLSRSFGDVL